MRLSALEVSNFRSLRNVKIDDLVSVTALVGRNNAGKTSILEAFLLLSLLRWHSDQLDGFSACLPWGPDPSSLLDDWRNDGDLTKPIEISLTFDLDPTDLAALFDWSTKIDWVNPKMSYRLVIHGVGGAGAPNWLVPIRIELVNSDRTFLIAEADQIQAGTVRLTFHSNDGFENVVRGSGRQAVGNSRFVLNVGTVMPIEGSLHTPLRLLFEWVTKVRFVGRTRRSQYTVPVAESNLLRSDGANLPRYLQNLLNNYPKQWEELKQIYRQLIPSLSDVFMPIRGDSTSVRVAVTVNQDAESAFALENMGGGTTHLATMIAMVWSTPPGGLCLLEEPEQGLHSSAQRELALWLTWHARETQKQLIIATHSSIFARPSNLIGVNLAAYSPESGTNVRRINPDEAPVINDELGARLTDFYAYDVLLFVEGDSEDVAIPILTAALSINLPELGVRVVPLFGDPATRLTRLREYLAYLKDSQVIPYVVLDSDKGVADAVGDLVQAQVLPRDNVHLWKRGEAPGEFEDNFIDAQLISVANAIAADAGATEIITEDDLAAKRHEKPKTMTSKLLREIYFAKHKYVLPKVSLSKKLAALAAADIAAGNRTYQFVPVLEHVRAIATRAGTATHAP
jgi:hypothetical protein